MVQAEMLKWLTATVPFGAMALCPPKQGSDRIISSLAVSVFLAAPNPQVDEQVSVFDGLSALEEPKLLKDASLILPSLGWKYKGVLWVLSNPSVSSNLHIWEIYGRVGSTEAAYE